MPDHMDNVHTDADRINWIEAHPCNIKWHHERGWIIQFGFPFGEGEGRTLRQAFDAAMLAAPMSGAYRPVGAPYGYCPHCGEPGYSRERRINGNDRCMAGHVYPSRAATAKPKLEDPR